MAASMTEWRELTDEEVVEKLKDTRRELFNLRFQKATGRLQNTARPALLRRDVARLLTILRERDLLEPQ